MNLDEVWSQLQTVYHKVLVELMTELNQPEKALQIIKIQFWQRNDVPQDKIDMNLINKMALQCLQSMRSVLPDRALN